MQEKKVNQYGFRTNSDLRFEDPLRLNARMEKWLGIISDWSEYRKNNPNQLKSRIRKGIPDPLRSRVWLLISNSIEIKKNQQRHLYFRLTNTEDDPPCMVQIQKDLDRTYPTHELFLCNIGQESLKNILRAYALYDPEIGYCQGMAYIVGIARMYMDEESAFWMLINIMQNYEMRDLFKEGMAKVYQCFYKANALLKIYEPAVWNRFKEIGFSTQIYSTQWFMTIFSGFPIETVLRIWDCFLLEGNKILFRVYVGIFKLYKNEFKTHSFESALKLVKSIENECDADRLINAAFSISLSRKKLVEIEREYAYNPNDELISWK